ncbi:hypothetical protein ACLBX9_09620 [Methylobacterium sp. A49B]
MAKTVSDAFSDEPEAARFDLECRCDHCDGTGRELTSRGVRPCTNCDATGLAPTKFGARILDFVRRHRCCASEPQNGS